MRKGEARQREPRGPRAWAKSVGRSEPITTGAVCMVWKVMETGELIGPMVPFGHAATRVVWAVKTLDGWSEVEAPKLVAR